MAPPGLQNWLRDANVPGRYCCSVPPSRCPGKPMSPDEIQKHIKDVHNTLPAHMICSGCGWTFKELARFVRHYFIMHEKKEACTECGLQFPNDGLRVSHFNEKHGVTPDNS
ncbi:hypothetical protein GY45DRAFT_1327209 [Cubamyces sp. BRFM 1775]|nr:hypothetical protein GY45DRAFT_1327209 [Cubamyces sp. BRFM 1775]